MSKQIAQDENPELSTFASVVGAIIGISYPVLAISTGARALYQLFLKEGVTNYVGPSLTAVAALLYLVATVGFARRTPTAWRVSVIALALELSLALIVGALSFFFPDVIGGTVWRRFGIDYAFFPLIQPILGLAWLLHPHTRRVYEARRPDRNQSASAAP